MQCVACLKRLGQGCFAWPDTTEPGALRIAAEELTLLLAGLDLAKTLGKCQSSPLTQLAKN